MAVILDSINPGQSQHPDGGASLARTSPTADGGLPISVEAALQPTDVVETVFVATTDSDDNSANAAGRAMGGDFERDVHTHEQGSSCLADRLPYVA